MHNLLIATGYPESKVIHVIKKAFANFPHLNMQELMPIVSNWLTEVEMDKEIKPERINFKKIKQSEWMSLPSDDLRFKFSHQQKSQNCYNVLQSSELLFDTLTWVQSM